MAKNLLAAVAIRGPDDLIPAPDGMTAIVWANRINAKWAARPNPHPDDPLFRAEAQLWPYDAESHAKGISRTEYAWLLQPDAEAETLEEFRARILRSIRREIEFLPLGEGGFLAALQRLEDEVSHNG